MKALSHFTTDDLKLL